MNYEDFNTGTFGTWTTYNVIGEQTWLIDNTFGIGGTPCAKMSGYSGAPVLNEDWLISPQLDITQFNNEILSFYSAMNFTGPFFSVLISENYTGGDPNTADWTEVSDELIFSQGGYQWTFSGYYDMSWLSGTNVRIAFKYLSDASGASTWEIDNISITGFYSGTNPVLNVIAPAAGAQWQQGTSQNVLWSAINTSPNIKIEVSANASSGNPTWTQIGNAAATAGSWTWNIPQSQPVGNDYKIRLTDYTSDITAYSGLFSIVAPPTIPDIVINEIMYNPATALGLDDYYEYVELYNNENTTVDLSGFTFPLGITFTFPQGTTMAAGSYLVVARNIDTLLAYYGPMNITGPFTGALSNSGEAIQLADGSSNIVDEVTYGIIDPWPAEPNGTGPSLSLLDPDLDNSLPESWTASAVINGTPGAANFDPITVTSPNGGEFWQQGTTHDITWTASGIAGNVKIELISTTGYQQVLAASVAATAGIWSWSIPPTQPLANNYKIKISEATTGNPSDESDALFTIIQPVYLPKIVITEIMYNPPELNNDSLEFIEIYNNDNITVDLNSYTLSNAVDFIFPTTTLTPGQYQLIAFNSTAIQNTFGKPSLQWTSGNLNNSGETIELKDMYGNMVDMVPYMDVLPWDTLADGDGPSLTLCDPNLDNSVPESWIHSTEFAAINATGDTIWATPGAGCAILPVADFTANNTSIQAGGNVVFTDLSTGNPTTWVWIFEGGTPGTYNGQTPPAIVYNTAGQYDVTLTVTNASGSDTEIKTNYITVTTTPPPPGVNFVGNPTTILQGQSVQFTDQSTNTPTSWSWTFPGGTPGSSTLQNPSIIYNTPGVYNVTLTATNQYGSNTLTKTNYITVNAIPPPIPNFTANVTNIPAGGSVNFTDQSTGNPTSWSWSFPGGTPSSSTLQNPSGIVYNNPGTYNVSLTVSNQYGSNTLTKTGYITVYDPNTAILVITEIMYNPPEVGEDSLEYIEIYNHGNAAANLNGYTFSQGVVFTFGNYTLNPGAYVVVAKNSAAMMNTFGVTTQQWTEGSLSNSGEVLELKNSQGTVVDLVQFTDLAPWPTQPDGAGPSLVLCNPALDNNVGSNWYASAEFVTNNGAGQPIYGTPGGPCVTTEVNEIMNNHTFMIYPNPASGSFSVLSDQMGTYNIYVTNLLGKTVYSNNGYELNTPVMTESWEKGMYIVTLFPKNSQSPEVFKLIIR